MTRISTPTKRPPRPPILLAGMTLLAALALAGCQHNPMTTGISDPAPADYRQRHPITVTEGERTLELFVGRSRGGLNPTQRADIGAFAQSWKRESTGGIIIDVPSGTPNAYAASDAVNEVRALLSAAGVPPAVIATRPYQPSDPRIMANMKLAYPKMTASAGPCGLWPEDLGPSANRKYIENGQYYNFGCAAQRNLAAMVENPADLVQPRGDTPIYSGRRSVVLDKHRKGESTATQYPDPEKGKISDVGK
jgi:pilus assembly protein CpaD